MSQQQDSDSISTEGNVVQGTPPKQDSKDRLWGAIAEFHARKKQRMIELKLEEEQEEQRRFEEAIQRAKEASSIRISRTEAGGEETQVAGSSRAAASLATMFAARLAVLGTQPNSKKVKQSASKKTWVKTRASARIAASRRANASATSGVKQKKPEVQVS